MYLKNIKPERLALLTPEQMKTVERWDREAQERAKLIPAMCGAYNSGHEDEAEEINRRILNMDAERCEHGRDKNSAHCIGCVEIERILFPEIYEDEDE